MNSTLVQLEDGEFKEEKNFPLSFLIIPPKLLSDGYTKIDLKEVVVLSFSCVLLFVIPWTAACQASLPFTNSQNLLKLMFIEQVMPSNHLILCLSFLLLSSIFTSIRVFSNESALHISGQSIGASDSGGCR